MRAIAVSDLHLDAVTNGVPRFDDICRALDQAIDRALVTKCTYFFVCGDYFDPDCGSAAYRYLAKLIEVARYLSDEGLTSYWITGNHCVVEDGSGDSVITPLEFVNSVPNDEGSIRVCQVPTIHRPQSRQDPTICALPFTASSHPYDPSFALEGIDDEEPLIVLSHLYIKGVIPGDETTVMARGRDFFLPIDRLMQRSGKTLVLNGHYHRRQRLNERIQIVGSLVQLNYGVSDPSCGYVEIDFQC